MFACLYRIDAARVLPLLLLRPSTVLFLRFGAQLGLCILVHARAFFFFLDSVFLFAYDDAQSHERPTSMSESSAMSTTDLAASIASSESLLAAFGLKVLNIEDAVCLLVCKSCEAGIYVPVEGRTCSCSAAMCHPKSLSRSSGRWFFRSLS